VADIVGAQSVGLYDLDGWILGSHGDFPADAAMAGTPDARQPLERVELHIPAGTLVLLASRYTPYFGRDELELLRSLGVMASQALDRCRLLERERRTLEALEEAQRIAHLGSWSWVVGSDHIEWSPELYRIHNLETPGTEMVRSPLRCLAASAFSSPSVRRTAPTEPFLALCKGTWTGAPGPGPPLAVLET
jgi:hypothetical protein